MRTVERIRRWSRWLLGLAALLRLTVGDAEAESTNPPECPDIDDDPNGRWEGSRKVGGNFTLSCARGFKVPGTGGRSSATLSCPENRQWAEEPRCVNIDDCAKLHHGCGAFGICTDKVDGYDCNCEEGYPPRRTDDGEIVCGDEWTDERLCEGHTCGAYGVCIDLEGDFPKFEQSQVQVEKTIAANHAGVVGVARKTSYRCECTDGFYDNGQTCVPYDCGRLSDKLGDWSGSTLFGGEYTLECPPEAFIWSNSSHTAQRRITITCGKKGKWLLRPVCHSDAREAEKEEMETLRHWTCLAAVGVCVCSAALAAGLTLGLATLEPFALTVLLATNPDDCTSSEARRKLQRERSEARRVLPVVRDHHQLLVTLLLFNTVANESLPIFLDELVPSWAAVLLSVSVVLICGEILPSAVFTGPSQMRIAATCIPLVKVMQAIFYVVANPIARLLDHLIEQDDAEDGAKYSRAELLALLQLHTQQPVGLEDSPDSRDFDDQTSPVMAHVDGSPPPASVQHLLFCGSEEAPEGDPGHECQDATEDPHCLAASELRLINGAMGLREVFLEHVPYARLHQCAFARAEDRASDAIARDVLGHGVRAVLVTGGSSSSSSGSRPPSLLPSSESSLAPVPVRAVAGCLRPLELLRGGTRTLGSLCTQPLVLVPAATSALRALQYFQQADGSTAGLVVHGDKVHGVVTRTDILGCAMHSSTQRDTREGDDMSGSFASPRRSPGSPAASSGFGLEDSIGPADSPRHLPLHRVKSNRPQLGLLSTLVPRSSSVEKVLHRSYTGDGAGPNSFSLSRRSPARFIEFSP